MILRSRYQLFAWPSGLSGTPPSVITHFYADSSISTSADEPQVVRQSGKFHTFPANGFIKWPKLDVQSRGKCWSMEELGHDLERLEKIRAGAVAEWSKSLYWERLREKINENHRVSSGAHASTIRGHRFESCCLFDFFSFNLFSRVPMNREVQQHNWIYILNECSAMLHLASGVPVKNCSHEDADFRSRVDFHILAI